MLLSELCFAGVVVCGMSEYCFFEHGFKHGAGAVGAECLYDVAVVLVVGFEVAECLAVVGVCFGRVAGGGVFFGGFLCLCGGCFFACVAEEVEEDFVEGFVRVLFFYPVYVIAVFYGDVEVDVVVFGYGFTSGVVVYFRVCSCPVVYSALERSLSFYRCTAYKIVVCLYFIFPGGNWRQA